MDKIGIVYATMIKHSQKLAQAISRALDVKQDQSLLDIARQQLYWVSGKNPFGQSLIYGEGSNYAQQCAALAGEMVGEMPVGVLADLY